MLRTVLLSLLIVLTLFAEPPASDETFSKEEKVLYTNLIGAAVILGWGYSQWDYGDQGWTVGHEGWFGKETNSGGADKLGHFYTNYLLVRVGASLFESWGYEREKAARYALYSGIFLNVAVMEVGDAFSHYGFAYQDVIMDVAGAFAGYLWTLNPSLAEKVDFRLEWQPQVDRGLYDFVTDYEHMKHLVAFKASGFELFDDTWLEYLELHVGYYARHFDYNLGPIEQRRRHLYVGLGLNLSKLMRPCMGRYAALFNYYQPPATYLPYDLGPD